MIRIEGIAVVAARLLETQKAKSARIPIRPLRTSKIAPGGRLLLAVRSAFQTLRKVA